MKMHPIIEYSLIIIYFERLWEAIQDEIVEQMRHLGRIYGAYSTPCLDLFSLNCYAVRLKTELTASTPSERQITNTTTAEVGMGSLRVDGWAIGSIKTDGDYMLVNMFNDSGYKQERVKVKKIMS